METIKQKNAWFNLDLWRAFLKLQNFIILTVLNYMLYQTTTVRNKCPEYKAKRIKFYVTIKHISILRDYVFTVSASFYKFKRISSFRSVRIIKQGIDVKSWILFFDRKNGIQYTLYCVMYWSSGTFCKRESAISYGEIEWNETSFNKQCLRICGYCILIISVLANVPYPRNLRSILVYQ